MGYFYTWEEDGRKSCYVEFIRARWSIATLREKDVLVNSGIEVNEAEKMRVANNDGDDDDAALLLFHFGDDNASLSREKILFLRECKLIMMILSDNTMRSVSSLLAVT